MVTYEIYIQHMVRQDLARVIQIDKDCYAVPWSEKEFLANLKLRNTIGLVAVSEDGIVWGYVIYALYQKTLVVLRLAADPYCSEKLGVPVGLCLMERLKGKLSPKYRRAIQVDVSERNLNAQIWLKHQDFKATEILKEEGDKGEDIYRFMFFCGEKA